jgi:hypothetical protein
MPGFVRAFSVGLGTGIAAAASILLSVLEDRAPATPLAVLVILSFIRSVATETVSQVRLQSGEFVDVSPLKRPVRRVSPLCSVSKGSPGIF